MAEFENDFLALAGQPTTMSLEELCHRHAEWLRRLLTRRLRVQPADIEDLLQETYLRAVRQPAAEIIHPKAFLSQTALNLFRDRQRRDAVRADHRRVVQQIARHNDHTPPGLHEQEAALELNRIVAEMPLLYRDVFASSRFAHMTNRDIAVHLDISVKTVEWRMGKALEFCMSRLKG